MEQQSISIAKVGRGKCFVESTLIFYFALRPVLLAVWMLVQPFSPLPILLTEGSALENFYFVHVELFLFFFPDITHLALHQRISTSLPPCCRDSICFFFFWTSRAGSATWHLPNTLLTFTFILRHLHSISSRMHFCSFLICVCYWLLLQVFERVSSQLYCQSQELWAVCSRLFVGSHCVCVCQHARNGDEGHGKRQIVSLFFFHLWSSLNGNWRYTTARTLLAILRLSQSLAKLKFANEVTSQGNIFHFIYLFILFVIFIFFWFVA